MKIEFSTIQRPQPPAALLPFCAYHVEADASYRCRKGVSSSRRGSALIRTVGGAGRLVLSGERVFELIAGTLLLVPAWKLEQYATSGEHWNFWWFEFENGEDFFPPEQLFAVESTEMEELLTERVMDAMRSANTESAVVASAFFSALMCHWREAIRPQLRPTLGGALSLLMQEIREFPEREYRIPETAARLSLSDRRFRTLFFEKTGMTPKEFIIHYRMERAGAMLLSTTLPVSQIAEACGYSDPLYFSRQFSRVCGVSPTAFRESGWHGGEDR